MHILGRAQSAAPISNKSWTIGLSDRHTAPHHHQISTFEISKNYVVCILISHSLYCHSRFSKICLDPKGGGITRVFCT